MEQMLAMDRVSIYYTFMFSLNLKENIHALKVFISTTIKWVVFSVVYSLFYSDVLNKYNENICNKLCICNNEIKIFTF